LSGGLLAAGLTSREQEVQSALDEAIAAATLEQCEDIHLIAQVI